ncbi:MAG TPA: FMN-binding protein [Acidimicrobiia bacterium]
MSRAVPAVVATLLGLLALATFKSSPGVPGKSASALPGRRSGAVATAPPRRSATTTAPPATSGSTPATDPGTNPPATPAPTTPATSNTTRTIDGDPFDNQYGTVQVRVTLRGHQIVDVTALQMPTDRQRSADISQQAEPLLQQEVLQAQSAQIDIIGGASYTSQSYAQSLQSALDKAGA